MSSPITKDNVFPKEDFKLKEPSKQGLVVILQGDAEAGKTFFIGTCPGTIFLLDMDDGTETLGQQYSPKTDTLYKGNFAGKDIRHLSIPVFSDDKNSNLEHIEDIEDIEFETNLVSALEKYEKYFTQIEVLAQRGELVGDTVALDTATWLWMASMDYMKYKVLKLNSTSKNYVNQQWDWDIANKKYINLYKRLVALRNYGVNVVITVHVKDAFDVSEGGGKTIVTRKDQKEPHWMKKSPQMSPLIINIQHKTDIDEAGKVVRRRISKCVRMRGVANARELFQPIEDITWDKLLDELENIRLYSKSEKVTPSNTESNTVSTTPTIKRRRRGNA